MKGFKIKIPKEKLRSKPRLGVKPTKKETPKTVYKRKMKHPKRSPTN